MQRSLLTSSSLWKTPQVSIPVANEFAQSINQSLAALASYIDELAPETLYSKMNTMLLQTQATIWANSPKSIEQLKQLAKTLLLTKEILHSDAPHDLKRFAVESLIGCLTNKTNLESMDTHRNLLNEMARYKSNSVVEAVMNRHYLPNKDTQAAVEQLLNQARMAAQTTNVVRLKP